jgi:hypothetical protein
MQMATRRSDMDAVSERWHLTRRRLVAIFLGVMAVALLAGGTGGYLIKGATTLVLTRTVQVQPPVSNPSAERANGLQEPYFGTQRTTGGYIPGL